MKALLALAGKDLRDILRERTIVVSLIVQLFVAGFSTFLSVGLMGLYDPSSIEQFPTARVGYVGPGGFDAYLDDVSNLVVVPTSVEQGSEDFRAGRLEAVVEETWTTPEGERTITLLLPDGTVEGTLLLTQVKALLQDYQDDLRQTRDERLVQELVYAPQGTGRGGSFSLVYSSILPLLVMTPVFLAGAIAGDSFIHEIQTRSMLLLRASPLSNWGIVLAKLVVPVALAPLQVLLWVGLLAANDLPVANLGLVLATTALLALLLASLSLGLAAWVRHEGQVQAAYALSVLVLAATSLALPADPLNLIALLSSGSTPPVVWETLGVLVGLALVACLIGLPFAARRIRRDQV